ncbi:hypothetical protein LCGC14_1605260 [marine sediment metagenome]|uniref:Uncharacterized protein n=2 Tax=marine sediment metagenome TaxID=412755 RepID=A0A0F9L9Y1_9ZZZZ
MTRTRKPCPGCGDPPSWQNSPRGWFEVGTVCSRCRRKLDEHPELVATIARMSSADRQSFYYGHFWLTDQTFDLDDRFLSDAEQKRHAVPGIYRPYSVSDVCEQAFEALVKAAKAPVAEPPEVDDPNNWLTAPTRYEDRKLASLDPGVAVTIRRLYYACRRVWAATYRCGYTDGQALLQKLVRGEVSVAEYSEQHEARP